jgi:hypothetical protein
MPQHATVALSRRLACHRRSARVLRNVPGCTSNRMPQHVTTAQCRRLTCHPQANLGTTRTRCAGLHQQPHAPVCQNCVVRSLAATADQHGYYVMCPACRKPPRAHEVCRVALATACTSMLLQLHYAEAWYALPQAIRTLRNVPACTTTE